MRRGGDLSNCYASIVGIWGKEILQIRRERRTEKQREWPRERDREREIEREI